MLFALAILVVAVERSAGHGGQAQGAVRVLRHGPQHRGHPSGVRLRRGARPADGAHGPLRGGVGAHLLLLGSIEPSRGVYDWAARPARGRCGEPPADDPRERARPRPVGVRAARTPSTRRAIRRRDPALYAELMRQLVCATGPRAPSGRRTRACPSVPDPAVADLERADGALALGSGPWAPSYTKLLKAAYQAIHKADRRAKVVAGSFVGVRQLHPVGRHPRPVPRRREGLLRRHRGPSVHEQPELGAATRSRRRSRSSDACARRCASAATAASRSSSPS